MQETVLPGFAKLPPPGAQEYHQEYGWLFEVHRLTSVASLPGHVLMTSLMAGLRLYRRMGAHWYCSLDYSGADRLHRHAGRRCGFTGDREDWKPHAADFRSATSELCGQLSISVLYYLHPFVLLPLGHR